jgi:SagB-type dehydrogenase family enzyme
MRESSETPIASTDAPDERQRLLERLRIAGRLNQHVCRRAAVDLGHLAEGRTSTGDAFELGRALTVARASNGRRALEASARFRRSRTIVGTWQGGELVLENYLTGKRTMVAPCLLPALARIEEFESLTTAMRRFDSPELAPMIIDRLVDGDVLVEAASPLADLEARLDTWKWGHDARFFHYSTRSIAIEGDLRAAHEALADHAGKVRAPEPYKHAGPCDVELTKEVGRPDDPFWRTLHERRTRREFAAKPMSFADFSELMLWTWGQTKLVRDARIGPYLLKTSPSGGARHPIEVYPLVLRVESITPGVYHYAVQDHGLRRLAAAVDADQVVRLCGNQRWLRDASAIFFMTAMVERTMWKYEHSRAYRVVLLDAGHLGQTFHLVCTRLGLAPFTTAATDDPAIEKLLGVDGVSEILVYTAAAGPLA